MAVHIRLARHGTKKSPFYRIVVTDHRNARDGKFIEHIGSYDPRTSPEKLELDRARFDYWRSHGAAPSHRIAMILKRRVTTPAATA